MSVPRRQKSPYLCRGAGLIKWDMGRVLLGPNEGKGEQTSILQGHGGEDSGQGEEVRGYGSVGGKG